MQILCRRLRTKFYSVEVRIVGVPRNWSHETELSSALAGESNN